MTKSTSSITAEVSPNRHLLPTDGREKHRKLNASLYLLNTRQAELLKNEIEITIDVVAFCLWAKDHPESYTQWRIATNLPLRESKNPIRQIARHAMDVCKNIESVRSFQRQAIASFADYAVKNEMTSDQIRDYLSNYVSVQDWYRKSVKNEELGRPSQTQPNEKSTDNLSDSISVTSTRDAPSSKSVHETPSQSAFEEQPSKAGSAILEQWDCEVIANELSNTLWSANVDTSTNDILNAMRHFQGELSQHNNSHAADFLNQVDEYAALLGANAQTILMGALPTSMERSRPLPST